MLLFRLSRRKIWKRIQIYFLCIVVYMYSQLLHTKLHHISCIYSFYISHYIHTCVHVYTASTYRTTYLHVYTQLQYTKLHRYIHVCIQSLYIYTALHAHMHTQLIHMCQTTCTNVYIASTYLTTYIHLQLIRLKVIRSQSKFLNLNFCKFLNLPITNQSQQL